MTAHKRKPSIRKSRPAALPAPRLPPEAYDRVPRAQLTLTDETLWLTRFDARGAAAVTFPVAVADAARAFRSLGAASTGLLPADVLFWQAGAGHARLGLWLPPARRAITWARGKRETRLRVPMPGFVFVGAGRQYWIWAATERPAALNALLFQAPLSNVNPDGLICAGDVPFPICAPATIHAAAALFFESRFNSDLSTERVTGGVDDLLKFLRSLKGARRFPARRLLAARRTMADVLKVDRTDEPAPGRPLAGENAETDPLGVLEDDEEPDPEWDPDVFMGDAEEFRDDSESEEELETA